MDDMDRDLQRLFTPENGWKNEAVKTIMDEAHHPGIRTTTPFNNASQDTSTAVLLERQHDTRSFGEEEALQERGPSTAASQGMVNRMIHAVNSNALTTLVSAKTPGAEGATSLSLRSRGSEPRHSGMPFENMLPPESRAPYTFWKSSSGYAIRQSSPVLDRTTRSAVPGAGTLNRILSPEHSAATPGRPRSVQKKGSIADPIPEASMERLFRTAMGTQDAKATPSSTHEAAEAHTHPDEANSAVLMPAAGASSMQVHGVHSQENDTEHMQGTEQLTADSKQRCILMSAPMVQSESAPENGTAMAVRFQTPDTDGTSAISTPGGMHSPGSMGSEKDDEADPMARTCMTYPTEPSSGSESEYSSSEKSSVASSEAGTRSSGSSVAGSETDDDDDDLFDYDLSATQHNRNFPQEGVVSPDVESRSGIGTPEHELDVPNPVAVYNSKRHASESGNQHSSKKHLNTSGGNLGANLSGAKIATSGDQRPGPVRSPALMQPQTSGSGGAARRFTALLERLPRHPELVQRSIDSLLCGFSGHDLEYLHQLASVRAGYERQARTQQAPKMLSSSKSAKVVGGAKEEEDRKKKSFSTAGLKLPKPNTGYEPPPGWREAATSLKGYTASGSCAQPVGDLSQMGTVLVDDNTVGRLSGAADITPAASRSLASADGDARSQGARRAGWSGNMARANDPEEEIRPWSEETDRTDEKSLSAQAKRATKTGKLRLAPMDTKSDMRGSDADGDLNPAVVPRPITNSNFVSSRSKTFDAQRSGNHYGYRRMPEMHSSMNLSQLQDIVHLYYCQAAEDFRAMNLVDTSKKPGRALAEARRHMTRAADRPAERNSALTAFNARFGTKSQTMSSQMQKASTPQEMLLQFVLDGRVSEEVFTSTLQREGRDIQDATVKLVCNFTARCAPQNRCQVAALCAVADMTAFANSLTTSKLEEAEAMLSSPPPSHDEATLLACSLATEWGHKQIGQMQPDVEMVLSSVYKCLAKVDARLAEQLEKLQKMRVRRQNAASLSQAAQRLMLATVKGMEDLEKRTAGILMEVLACSHIILLGFSPEAKEIIVRGEKEPMWPSAMADCILEGEVAHFTSYEDERITEHDIRRLEKYLPGVHMRSMLVVPVRCQQAGNRMSCAGLLVALNKRLKVPGGYTEEFDDKDAEEMLSAGDVIAPSMAAAVLHTQSQIANANAAARAERAKKLLEFSYSIYKKLNPDEIWKTIRRDGPPMLGCQFMLMYVYVERGILAVHNPETGVLEYLTMNEAALAGQMFQEDQPKFISTRRQAERLFDPSVMQVRVALDLDPAEAEAEDTRGHELFEDPPLPGEESSEVLPRPPPEGEAEKEEALNDFLMPAFEGKVSSMLLLPLKQVLSKEEARAFRGEPDGKQIVDSDTDGDSDYSYDDEDDYLGMSEERLKAKEVETTWAVLVAVNKLVSPQQEKEIELQKQVQQTARKQRSVESPAPGRYLEMPRVEFTPTDERAMESLGKILYPAIVHSHLRIALQEHLHSITAG